MKTEQELRNTLGLNVKKRRKHKGLSQEKLAEKIGVSKNTVSDIESGDKFARADTLIKLAKILETEVYELLKPKDISPDNTADAIAIYSEEVKEAVERVQKSYLGRKKDRNE
jgi:transcriptional regulator with XRE-family HTH domain